MELGRWGVYAMYSMEVVLWLRREQVYSSAQASTDRKAGRLSLLFYSIEFFDSDGLTQGFHQTVQATSHTLIFSFTTKHTHTHTI